MPVGCRAVDGPRHATTPRASRDLLLRMPSGLEVGESHPVWDFLFSYYSLRPRQLRCWHPGYGVVLAGDDAIRRYRDRRGYAVDASGVTVSRAYLLSRLETISFVARLLRGDRSAAGPVQLLRAARMGDGLSQR